jgi:2,4-dienoyl-CoA reductase-like NADH-dependent reductase (Old Yellow Enzyme family)/NADPH-dependent 2,4-dienoyl-CoA reductase/sulfur reductase-like enzyme
MFQQWVIGNLTLVNRFVFPPVKLGYGTPDGAVTDRQLRFYQQIANHGPGLVIVEPVSVTADGREHPKQACIHLDRSVPEMKKIADVIHREGRLAVLHLNHAGAAANPKVIGGKPKGPSSIVCPTTEEEAVPLTAAEIRHIVLAYREAAQKAVATGFDLIEIQAGHGYLVSQFLNSRINRRDDPYGRNRLLFAEEVLSAVRLGAPHLPLILRISGSEMNPEFGISREDLQPLLKLAEDHRISLIHVGMGSSCFSPPWYFHHGSLPYEPQWEALTWVRKNTSLPLIAAGRLGRKERVIQILNDGLADLVALGRPLIADPDLIGKWKTGADQEVFPCGYCLQGCLHRLKNGQPLGCNVNPALGRPPLPAAAKPLKILVAGGGPAGMSAALFLQKRGHAVTLAEKAGQLGGQFALAWQAPGKASMKAGLEAMENAVRRSGISLRLNQPVEAAWVREQSPDLLVWATGSKPNIPEVAGLAEQYWMTATEYFQGAKEVKGPRVLVLGAGRTGIEIAEKLGRQGIEVVATKRTDPIGSMMEMITRKLCLMRIGQMKQVTLLPRTTVKGFGKEEVEIEQDGTRKQLEPFQTVILASGMVPSAGPEETILSLVPRVETVGDAGAVGDIYSAVQAGYELAVEIG